MTIEKRAIRSARNAVLSAVVRPIAVTHRLGLVRDRIPLLIRGGLGLVVGLLAGRRQEPTYLHVRPSTCRFERMVPDDLRELLRLGAGIDRLAWLQVHADLLRIGRRRDLLPDDRVPHFGETESAHDDRPGAEQDEDRARELAPTGSTFSFPPPCS